MIFIYMRFYKTLAAIFKFKVHGNRVVPNCNVKKVRIEKIFKKESPKYPKCDT